MFRDDDGLVRDFGKVGFRGAEHTVDAAAGRIVDEGVKTVPPRVAGDKDIVGG